MKISIFGLSISSSWGNGHATIWRGLVRELIARNHQVTFFERDVNYYADNRDFFGMDGLSLILYRSWNEIEIIAASVLNTADVAVVTSYCPDAIVASDLIFSREVPMAIFYDLDTPVTLKKLEAGESIGYIGKRGLKDFDLVLSFTGGGSLNKLREKLGAQTVIPLYGCVDPDVHKTVNACDMYRSALSYLGTFASDRQKTLESLFIQSAKKTPHNQFIIAGAQYPQTITWEDNIKFIPHITPNQHSEFYCSSKFTLNITRKAMAEMGFCPSGRLFEAGACGVPVISDNWAGIEKFYEPGIELIIANNCEDVIKALNMGEDARMKIASAFQNRTLNEHTSKQRVNELEKIIREF